MTTPNPDDTVILTESTAYPARRIKPEDVLGDALGHLIDAVDMILYHVTFDPHDQSEAREFLSKAGRNLRQFRDARRAETD